MVDLSLVCGDTGGGGLQPSLARTLVMFWWFSLLISAISCGKFLCSWDTQCVNTMHAIVLGLGSRTAH